MDDLGYTGERVVPGKVNSFLWNEHVARYLAASHFVHNKTVLDVGCGAGYGSDYLRAAGATHVVGIDISPDAISYAQTHYTGQNLQFEVMDATSLKIDDKKFDVVVAFEMIERLNDQEKFLKEALRVLKQKGIFIVSTPDHDANPPEYVNPFHRHEFTKNEFEMFLKKYFKHVQLYFQNHIFGIIISPVTVNEISLDNSLFTGKRQSQYLVAVCSQAKLPEDIKLLFPTFYDPSEYLSALQSTYVEMNELKTLVDSKDFLSALEYSSKHLAKYEDNAEWLYQRAFCLHMTKNYEEALKCYDLALKKGFDEFWIRYNRGSMLVEMGNLSLGREDLERAVQLNPSHEGVKMRLEETRKSGPNQDILSNFLNDTTVYGNHILWETPVQLCVKDFTKAGDRIFDVGANIGALSIAFSRLVGKSGEVHAFEPNPFVIPKLERDLHANNITNVKIINKGLWSKSSEKLPFYCDNTVYSSASSFLRISENSKLVLVDVISIDDYCKQNNIFPQLIKIDAEYAEDEVIKGAEETIKKHHPVLVFEYVTSEKSDPIQHIKSLGYRCYDVNTYQEVDDNQYYLSHYKSDIPFNILAIPSDDTSYLGIILEPISELYLDGKFSSDFINLELSGRYIVKFYFEGPQDDSKIAGLRVYSSDDEIISSYEANLRILKAHCCTNVVLEIEKPTKIKGELFGKDIAGFNFIKIRVERIIKKPT